MKNSSNSGGINMVNILRMYKHEIVSIVGSNFNYL